MAGKNDLQREAPFLFRSLPLAGRLGRFGSKAAAGPREFVMLPGLSSSSSSSSRSE